MARFWLGLLVIAVGIHASCGDLIESNYQGETDILHALDSDTPPSAEEWARLKEQLKDRVRAPQPQPYRDPVAEIPVPPFVKLRDRPRMDAELRQQLEETRERIARNRQETDERRNRRLEAHRRRLDEAGPMSEHERAMAVGGALQRFHDVTLFPLPSGARRTNGHVPGRARTLHGAS